MPTEFFIQLVCPFCFRSKWIRGYIQHITREALLNGRWQFECPVHGWVCEKPLQVQEKHPLAEQGCIPVRWLQ